MIRLAGDWNTQRSWLSVSVGVGFGPGVVYSLGGEFRMEFVEKMGGWVASWLCQWIDAASRVKSPGVRGSELLVERASTQVLGHRVVYPVGRGRGLEMCTVFADVTSYHTKDAVLG